MSGAYQLRPWTDVVAPHPDVESGKFEMGTFAANLAAVAYRTDETASVYADAAEFFAATYLTPSMHSLLGDVFGALAGGRGDRVVQLRTPFGGGKTHTLLALLHLARARDRAVAAAEGALDDLPDPGTVRIAVLSGEYLDPARGREVEGRRIGTLWGELAYQIGGWKAYEALLVDGEESTPPGGQDLVPLLASKPTLILLDELLVYVVKARALPRGETTAGQLALTFVQNLSEAVNQTQRAAMVYSLQASVGEAVHEEGLLRALEHITARIDVRKEPVTGEQVLRVVQRRLFQAPPDDSVVDEVAREYSRLLREDLHAHAETDDERREASEAADLLRKRIAECYPFHPELIDLMYQRWGSLPSYQRTRGALQFLAAVVYALWSRRASHAPQALIGPGDVDLSEDRVRASFFEQVGEATQYAAVVQADFLRPDAGTRIVDERIGRESPALRSLQVGTRVATAIALLSFGAREGEDRGALEREVVQASLVPNLDGNVIREALKDLRRETLLYLHHTGRRYRFETRPNLNKLIADEEAKLTSEEVIEAVRRRLERTIGMGGQVVSVWPQDSTQIADRLPAFVIAYLPIDTDASPEALARLVTHAGNAPRKHKNGLALVVAGTRAGESARRAARTVTAVTGLLGASTRHQFGKEQKEELKERASDAERTLATNVGQLYERIALPIGTEGPGGVRFETVELGTVLAAGHTLHERVYAALAMHVFERLKAKRLLALSKLAEQASIRCDELLEAFFSYYEFTKLWGAAALSNAIAEGVEAEAFAYAVGVSEQDGRLSVAEPGLIHLAPPLDQAEIDLGSGSYLLSNGAAQALLGEGLEDQAPSVVGGTAPSTSPDEDSSDRQQDGSQRVGDGGSPRGRNSVTLRIAASHDDLHTLQRALSGLRDVTLPGTVRLEVEAVAQRPDGPIDEISFRNLVREPLEEDEDVSFTEAWE